MTDGEKVPGRIEDRRSTLDPRDGGAWVKPRAELVFRYTDSLMQGSRSAEASIRYAGEIANFGRDFGAEPRRYLGDRLCDADVSFGR